MSGLKPWRVSRASLISLAMALFVAIFAARMLVEDPIEPITFLMVIPIGLLAAEFGLLGGLIGAAVASVLVVVWDLIVHPDLTVLGFSLRFLVFTASGLSIGFMAHTRDALESESSRWFDQSSDLNAVANFEGNFIRVNKAFERALGYRSSDLLDAPYISFVHPDDVEETNRLAGEHAEGRTNASGFENRYRAADGSYRWLRWTTTTDESRALIYATARDVTETKKLEAELLELAQTDPLTGLFNRRAFEGEAERQLDFLRRYGPGGAVMLFDIDRFKSINDSYGHKVGDEALKKVADVIAGRKRGTDTSARLGGDEFVILFPGVGPKEAELLATGLLGSIREQSVGPEGSTINITSSIGVALVTQADAEHIGTLVAKADQSMYEAKRAGGDRFSFATKQLVL